MRDKVIDEFGGYLGITFEGTIQNYLNINHNEIVQIPIIIVELYPNDNNFNIIKHTNIKTLNANSIERLNSVNNPSFCLYYRVFEKLIEH